MKTKLLLAALICGTVTSFASDLKQGQLTNVTRLTSDKSVRYENPVWAPDGQQVAFCAEGFNGLYVMNTATRTVKQISNDTGVGYMFQWSADSREILVRDTRLVSTGEGVNRVHAAFAIDMTGKKVRLTDDNADMKPAAWRYDATGRKSIVATNATVRIVNLPKLSTGLLKKTSAAAPVAGVGISFVEDFENLYIVDQAGNKRVLNAGPSFNAALSPDGKRVVFNQMDDIYVINVDGTGKHRLGVGFRPQWVNNSQVIFERTTDNGHAYTAGDLYMINIATGAEKALTATNDRIEMFPSVSPDGSKIAFTSNTDGQIYVAELK